MKKKIIALCLAAAMVIVAAIGTTLAFLTDTDKATNIFAVGNVEVSLTEEAKVLDVNGDELTAKVAEIKDGDKVVGHRFTQIMPTNEIVKKATFKNEDANTNAYLRVAVVVNNLPTIKTVLENSKYEEQETIFKGNSWFNTDDSLIANATTDNVLLGVDTYTLDANIQSFASGIVDDATVYNMVNSEEIAYIYYIKLDANQSYTLDLGLDVPNSFGKDELAMYDGLSVEIYADAIQAEGFNGKVNGVSPSDAETAKNAFTALEEAHKLTSVRIPATIFVEPGATVVKLDEAQRADMAKAVPEIANIVNNDPSINYEDVVPYALTFTAEEQYQEYAGKVYENWNADYVIRFSNDIPNGGKLGDILDASDEDADVLNNYCNDQIALIGHYDFAGTYAIPMYIENSNGDIEANKDYRVMGIFDNFMDGFYPLPYAFVVDYVNKFDCGVVKIPGSNIPAGTKVTVELRMYETVYNDETKEYEENGVSHLIVSDTYTF